MSLFPDDYPAPDSDAGGPDGPCCDEWDRFVDERAEHHLGVHFLWHVVHRFAHGRIPFTVEALAERARTTPSSAGTAIEVAVERGWIAPVMPEFPGQVPQPLWLGRLERRGK